MGGGGLSKALTINIPFKKGNSIIPLNVFTVYGLG